MKRAINFALIILFCLLVFTLRLEASITLRVVAVNPSEEQIQTVPIKVYLPIEVKPESIIYKEDLDVAYDAQLGSYYVFGEYELKPLEVLEKEIEIKDVWTIDVMDILYLRKEAKDVFSGFERTGYAEKATALYQGIEKKLNEIDDLQRVAANNPSQHISDYRYCVSQLNSAKNDLLAAKTLLAEIQPRGLAKLTWKIIIFIISFLGILGLAFYIIWQRQVKLEQEEKSSEEPKE
ncbi:MAG: hypothetical protein V1925_00330 [Candidatus Omnitrophota bacterium]